MSYSGPFEFTNSNFDASLRRDPMFAFLKKLGKKTSPIPAAIPVAAPVIATTPVTRPSSVAPAARSAPATNGFHAPPPSAVPQTVVLPPSRTAQPAVSAAPAPEAPEPAEVPASTETVALPLNSLWTKLNPTVLQNAAKKPSSDAFLNLPLNLVQSHLSKGALKIPYAQLRRFSPEGLFRADPSKDTFEVEIPLTEVLPRLKPEHLRRRPNQKKVTVPDDIANIFGSGGGPAGLRVMEQKPAAGPAKLPSRPSAAPAAPAPIAQVETSKPIAPTPAVAAQPVAAITQAVPIQPISTVAPTPVTNGAPAVAAPAPAPPEPLVSEPIRAPKLDPSLASLRPKPSAEGVFTLALMDVASFWTEKGRTELANLYRHSLEIPAMRIESALKTGKIQFLWREVKPWVRLAPGNTLPTIPDELQVELPLALLAPRFLEQRGMLKPKQKVELASDIPDVFAKRTPAPAEEATENGSARMDLSAIPLNGARPLLEFGEIFGQPEKKDWSLSEVTQRASGLRGVSGAIIATSDGLLIAGQWPNGVKTDSVAAFVPQMYSRIVQYSTELKLGDASNFTLMVENVPLQIFKTGNSFFTVLGRAGENLPKAQLTAVATRLSSTSTTAK